MLPFMSDSNIPEAQPTPEPEESFADILSQYEQSHSHRAEDGSKQLEGTVIAVSAESVFLDIGYKSEGSQLVSAFRSAGFARHQKHDVRFPGLAGALKRYYELSR